MTLNTISIEQLIKLNLSPDEYLYMRLLVDDDGFNMAALRNIKTYRPNMALLIERGWIVKEGEEGNTVIRSTGKFEELTVVGFDSAFIELCTLYPTSTPSGRKLQQGNATSKKEYIQLLKKHGGRVFHEHILKCLILENVARARKIDGKDSKEYYLSLNNWISKEGWKVYEKELEEGGVVGNTSQLL
jgi:hypothetical protein